VDAFELQNGTSLAQAVNRIRLAHAIERIRQRTTEEEMDLTRVTREFHWRMRVAGPLRLWQVFGSVMSCTFFRRGLTRATRERKYVLEPTLTISKKD